MDAELPSRLRSGAVQPGVLALMLVLCSRLAGASSMQEMEAQQQQAPAAAADLGKRRRLLRAHQIAA